MIGHAFWTSSTDDAGTVRLPLPGDAVGSALRSVYGETPTLPDDMARLLRHLEREKRRH